jgi:hypothetical protein
VEDADMRRNGATFETFRHINDASLILKRKYYIYIRIYISCDHFWSVEGKENHLIKKRETRIEMSMFLLPADARLYTFSERLDVDVLWPYKEYPRFLAASAVLQFNIFQLFFVFFFFSAAQAPHLHTYTQLFCILFSLSLSLSLSLYIIRMSWLDSILAWVPPFDFPAPRSP